MNVVEVCDVKSCEASQWRKEAMEGDTVLFIILCDSNMHLLLLLLLPVLKVVQERSRVCPAIRGRVPPPQNFLIYF